MWACTSDPVGSEGADAASDAAANAPPDAAANAPPDASPTDAESVSADAEHDASTPGYAPVYEADIGAPPSCDVTLSPSDSMTTINDELNGTDSDHVFCLEPGNYKDKGCFRHPV
jgi:hypothetical protein